MYEHVKTGCKHIPPSEQPLQFQSRYYLNKPRMVVVIHKTCLHEMEGSNGGVADDSCPIGH